jgi:hypothetical protein
VWAVGPAIGVGASAKSSPPISFGGTLSAEFEDSLSDLNPLVFNGFFSAYYAGVTASPYTAGIEFVWLGGAKNLSSLGMEYSVGLGLGLAYTIGSSTVVSHSISDCSCK